MMAVRETRGSPILLPLTVDAYAATATRVWLAPTTRSAQTRRFARANALGAITTSITGNATYHALTAGVIDMTWPILVTVGSAPAAALGLLAHLAVLRTQPEPAHQDKTLTEDQPAWTSTPAFGRSQDGPAGDREGLFVLDQDEDPALQDEGTSGARDAGLSRARAADRDHRDSTGHPITRDALRRELGIGTSIASTLLHELRSQ